MASGNALARLAALAAALATATACLLPGRLSVPSGGVVREGVGAGSPAVPAQPGTAHPGTHPGATAGPGALGPGQAENGRHVVLVRQPGGPPGLDVAELDREYERLAELVPTPAGPLVFYLLPSREDYERVAGELDCPVDLATGRAYLDGTLPAPELRQVAARHLALLMAGISSPEWLRAGLALMAEEPYTGAAALLPALNWTAERIHRYGAPGVGVGTEQDAAHVGYAFVTYLRGRYGPWAFRRFLAAAREGGGDVDGALARVLGTGRARVEQEFGQAVLARLAGDMGPWVGRPGF